MPGKHGTARVGRAVRHCAVFSIPRAGTDTRFRWLTPGS